MTFASIGEFIVVQRLAFLYNYKSANLMDKKSKITIMDITSLIGETTAYDKKETLEEQHPKSWLKSVSAFANGNGGMLVFGISDDDVVVGLDDAERIAEIISERKLS